jgi:acyl transferase domain-containing protein
LLSFHSNGLDQAATLALQQAGFSPETIDYHECHGNGIPISDHAEIEALDRVYGPALKQAKRSLPLGSVKNQIGYLMAASGLAGVIKAALCIRHRIIPAQHGFTSPHPDLRLEERPLHIPRVEEEVAPTPNRAMRASVSSIGFGGMFYHVILEGEEEKSSGALSRNIGPRSTHPPAFQPVAIVGMGGIFPGAGNVGELWSNTLKRDCCVRPVPRNRLDPDLHVDKTRARIWRSYTDLGTVIDPYPVPPPVKGMWPTQIQAMNPTQVLTIHCVEEALRDAGIGAGDWDPQRVVFAVGEIHNRMREIESRVRVEIGGMLSYLMTSFGLKGLPEDRRRECLLELGKILGERYPKVDSDHLFGYLSCVNTGRIAHRYNIQGFHLTTETVCSSSLTALTVCLQALQLHRCDLAIAGGVWANLTPEFYAQLCYLNAVSQHGVFPFDQRADGVVPGEGGGMVVVKRLDDAVKAGDRIHAVILGMGSSSDGRFKTILAPNPDAQVLAIQRAFFSAGIDPATVDFVECHGASTKGDLVEIDSLKRGYGENGGQPLYLGSVKANVGHLNAAAGVASVIKTTLALAHKTIPPMAQFETPHPDADFGRLTIPLEPLPWNRTNGPRRAGLNSLGMMGHNYHLLLEEWPG